MVQVNARILSLDSLTCTSVSVVDRTGRGMAIECHDRTRRCDVSLGLLHNRDSVFVS